MLYLSLYNETVRDLIYQAVASDEAAFMAYEALSSVGGRVYVVGGAVRDSLLGKKPKDVDLVVVGLEPNVVEEVLKRLPGRVSLEGKAFGVFRFRTDESEVEIALPRSERSTGISHKDFAIDLKQVDPSFNQEIDHYLHGEIDDPPLTYPIGIEDDLGRRDFTANAMALDLETGYVHDPFGGIEHIDQGILRLVNPQAFQDDPLRILRAFTAYARHNLRPDKNTISELSNQAHRIRHVAPERIKDELDKIITSQDPHSAFLLMQITGVLDYFMPELSTTFGFDQRNPGHKYDVGNHILEVFSTICELTNDPDVRIAALLHDIGKPDSFWVDENGEGHFYAHPDYPESNDHEIVGAKYAEALLKRLRFPNERISRIVNLVRKHMFHDFQTTRGARKFLAYAGDPKTAFDLLDLREADLSGKGFGRNYRKDMVERMRELVRQVIEENSAFTIKDLAINGNDLIRIGIPPGPEMGKILNELLNIVIENPSLNKREELINIVSEMYG